MQVGPGCYTVAPARSISVRGPMFPWQRRYRIAMQEVANAPWFDQTVRSSAQVGRRLLTMEAERGPLSWMEVDIQPAGTILFGDNALLSDEVPTLDGVVSVPAVLKGWSPAKVQLLYHLASGETRVVRFDIGNGVTLRIPPTHHVEGDLLVWDDEGLDEVVAPPQPTAVLRGRVNFATTVSCKVTAVRSGSEIPRMRFTQLVYLPGADQDLRNAQVPLENQVDIVQLYASPEDPSPGGDLVIGDIAAIFRTETTDTPQGTPADGLSAVFPQIAIDWDSAHMSRRTEVPHPQANCVRLQMTDATKSANVIVSQEIF